MSKLPIDHVHLGLFCLAIRRMSEQIVSLCCGLNIDRNDIISRIEHLRERNIIDGQFEELIAGTYIVMEMVLTSLPVEGHQIESALASARLVIPRLDDLLAAQEREIADLVSSDTRPLATSRGVVVPIAPRLKRAVNS